MIRVLYFSQSIPALTNEDIKDILAAARKYNQSESITGVLVHGGNLFAQILEGPQLVVMKRLVRILEDKRHGNVQILRVTPIKKRIFNDWAMAFVDATPLQFQEIARFRDDYLALEEPEEFTKSMRGFLDLLKDNRKPL